MAWSGLGKHLQSGFYKAYAAPTRLKSISRSRAMNMIRDQSNLRCPQMSPKGLTATGGTRAFAASLRGLSLVWKIALAMLVVAGTALLLMTELPRAGEVPTGESFTMFQGRPWAPIRLDGNVRMALVDTGTSVTVLNSALAEGRVARDLGPRIVRSSFGRYSLPIAVVHGLSIADAPPGDATVLLSTASTNVIGAASIFATPAVMIGRDRLDFAPEAPRKRAAFCAPLVLDLLGGDLNAPISAVYFMLDVDGRPQKVLFDTGRQELLTGTALAPVQTGAWVPRFEFRRSVEGEHAPVLYYPQTGALRLGQRRLDVDYHRQPGLAAVAAPYVLGAAILDDYDILIERPRGRACFFAHVR